MAKFNFLDFLLTKGDKIALGLAAGGLAVFGGCGLITLAGADSPSEVVSKLNSGTTSINSGIANANSAPADLPPEFKKGDTKFQPLPADQFAGKFHAFEPTDQPSKLRDNPKVLRLVDAQIDLVRAPIKAYDLQVSKDGSARIGVLKQSKIGKNDQEAIQKAIGKDKSRFNKGRAAPPAQPPGGPGMGPGGPGMGPPGMGPGMGGEGGYGSGMGFDASGERVEAVVTYIPVDELKDADVAALTIFPQRMIVVHGLYPLKEQLEVIRKSLKLKTIQEAADLSGSGGTPGPTFAGLVVQRMITYPDGRQTEWEDFDHVAQYETTIFNRKYGDQLDEGFLPLFLRYEQMMATPLPALADSSADVYPKIRMPLLTQTVKKMQDARKVPPTKSEIQKKFGGKSGGNPFLPQTGNTAGGGGGSGFLGEGGSGAGIDSGGGVPGRGPGMSGPGFGGPGGSPGGPGFGPGGVPPGMPPPGRGGPGMGGMPPPGYGPGMGGPGSGYGGQPQLVAPVELEHLVVRFLDSDIRPGLSYEYRVKVKMRNPNYDPGNKKKLVAKPQDAEVEELAGPWAPISRVTVPFDLNMYATDPVEYSKTVKDKYKENSVVNLLNNADGKQPVVQLQQWLPEVRIEGSKREPVGMWVVGEVPVARGERIGRKTLVSLPMWSAEKLKYLMQELPKLKVAKAREQPKGMLVDFTTPALLVDYSGGKERAYLPDGSYRDEEAGTELLVLTPNGLLVRNSATDMPDPSRVDVQQKWDDWVKKVEEDTRRAGPLSGSGDPAMPGGSGFGRP